MAEANPTLADLLFGAPRGEGEGADAAAGARAAIERGEFPDIRARVNELPEISWPAASGAIADALKDALDVTLADVLKGAWAKANELDAALKRPAGETTLVPLAEHTVKSVHHPEVEVVARHPVAGGAPAQESVIATLVFDAEFVLTLEGVVLKVRDGAIADITSGTLA
ncbi:MAG TPA: hypothetical protein VK862_06940, partial [Afifellaceae bacterium]|nr:hypothetical protein [Afifellaceae bacterium]